MKKTLYSLVLVVIGSIVSYFLGIEFVPSDKKCPPTQQENSLIRIDLADNDDDEENGEIHVKNTAKPKQPDKEST